MSGHEVEVICKRGGKQIARYEFLVPASAASPPIINRSELIQGARENLTNAGLISPLDTDIEFEIRRIR